MPDPVTSDLQTDTHMSKVTAACSLCCVIALYFYAIKKKETLSLVSYASPMQGSTIRFLHISVSLQEFADPIQARRRFGGFQCILQAHVRVIRIDRKSVV